MGHLPNLEDRDIFAATFALLCLIELQNVLDFRSYVCPESDKASVWYGVSVSSMTDCDINEISHEERLECIYTRGLASELASCIFSHYQLTLDPQLSTHGHQQDPWIDFYWPYLAHFMVAIEVYKGLHPKKACNTRGCHIDLVRKQLKRCIDQRPELVRALTAIDGANIKSIAPPFPFLVAKRATPLAFSRRSICKNSIQSF
jgi:hypothetical protein